MCKYAKIPEDVNFNVYRAMDKFERIGMDGVKENLEVLDLPKTSIDKLINAFSFELPELAKLLPHEEGVKELQDIFEYLDCLGNKSVVFDPSLARGFDYYTGPIFETVVEGHKIGSVAGGGRYDKLVGMFLPERGAGGEQIFPPWELRLDLNEF